MDFFAGIKTYIYILSSCILYPVLLLLAGMSVWSFYECGKFFAFLPQSGFHRLYGHCRRRRRRRRSANRRSCGAQRHLYFYRFFCHGL